MKLSNSQLDTYNLCARKWRHRYIDKLYSPKISSPLFFGSALDEAFSYLLLAKKEDLTDAELDLQLNKTVTDVFYEKMLTISHNKQTVELSQSPFADYYTSDFSPELMGIKQEALLQQLEPSYKLVDFLDFHLQCKEQLAARKKLQGDDQILYNYMSWLSLVEKGKLMIDAYKTTIMPQISKVYDIQKDISIKNDDGDEIVGKIDFTASFTDAPNVKHIVDNKTSSKPYEENSVETSQQLSVYCEAESIPDAAYIVIEKKLFKRAPQIRANIIKGKVSEETYKKTFDLMEKTCYSIQSQVYTQNWDSCFMFGRPCEYLQICKYNDYSNVVKLDKAVPVVTQEEAK